MTPRSPRHAGPRPADRGGPRAGASPRNTSAASVITRRRAPWAASATASPRSRSRCAKRCAGSLVEDDTLRQAARDMTESAVKTPRDRARVRRDGEADRRSGGPGHREPGAERRRGDPAAGAAAGPELSNALRRVIAAAEPSCGGARRAATDGVESGDATLRERIERESDAGDRAPGQAHGRAAHRLARRGARGPAPTSGCSRPARTCRVLDQGRRDRAERAEPTRRASAASRK